MIQCRRLDTIIEQESEYSFIDFKNKQKNLQFSNQHKNQGKSLKQRDIPDFQCFGHSEAPTQDELNFQKGLGGKVTPLSIYVIKNQKSSQIETRYHKKISTFKNIFKKM